MKPKLPAFALILLTGLPTCFADHFTLDIGTTVPAAWTVSSSGISNVPPFAYYLLSTDGVSVTSTGKGNGYFLSGSNASIFDGFWSAKTVFYLPPAASNVILSYSGLGFDDAGILYLNGVAIGAAETKNTVTNGAAGRIVFAVGAPSQPWTFSGPEGLVSGTVTNSFLPGRTNILSSIVNNTGQGANGVLRGFVANDATSFGVAATVSYDLLISP